jgi:alcohol dehydrogenase
MSAATTSLPPGSHFVGSSAPFDFTARTRIVFGAGAVSQVGSLAREYGATRVLLVTDAGIVKAGHAEKARASLEAAGLQVALFDGAEENPTTRCIAAALEVAQRNSVDFIVGIGGGSSMDTAKGCNFLYTNGGEMKDYWGTGKAQKPLIPFIAIPTTSGTGSECQSYALIADEKTHAKMACGDPKAAARVAILDPTLTVSQPRRVTACTGIDALTHAVETAVTKKRNPLSLMFSEEAFKLCVTNFPIVLNDPSHIEARGKMQLAAAFAGTAIENSMLGAAHSMANPLTARFNIVHGEAVGIVLPAVIRFNAGDPAAKLAYAELASAPELACVSHGLDQAVDALVARIDSLLNLAGMARSLADLNVDRASIPTLAKEAHGQWTRHFNPREVTIADFENLYAQAFEPRGDGDLGTS